MKNLVEELLRSPRFWSVMIATSVCNVLESVVTCQHIAINSSASATHNATEIAVKKVSDVEVVRFGPEL